MTRTMLCATCVLAAVLLATASPASAEIIQSVANASFGSLPVSATDLANDDQPSFASITATPGVFGGNSTYLVDGTMSLPGNTDINFTPPNGSVVTIQLSAGPGSNSPLGYDISSIVTTTGFIIDRAVQNYDVAYETVGGVWNSLPSVVNLGTEGFSDEVQVTTQDNSNPWIATGVEALKFTFHDAGSPAVYSTAVYQEIDVNGRATPSSVPEPGTLALLASGVIGLAYAWRKRK